MEMPTPEPVAEPKKANKTLIIVAVVAIVLCCCCLIAAGGAYWLWNNGDALLGIDGALLLNTL
jgi:hypothetical protein